MVISEIALYEEEQRLSQWWVWVIILGVAAVGWWGFLEQILGGRPFGDKPAPDWLIWIIFLIFGLLAPVTLFVARLIVIVVSDEVRIRWIPFGKKIVPLAEIETCQARKYRPLLEYGGWGVRWAPKRGWAWNAHGDEGVQLVLRGGKRLLIGSQRAEELAEVIRRLKPLTGLPRS